MSWHAGELDGHLIAHFGVGFGGVGGPQQKRNTQRQKLQGRVREDVLAQKSHGLSAHRSPDIGQRGGQYRSGSAAREYFRQPVAEFSGQQIGFNGSRGGQGNRAGFFRDDDHDGVAVLGHSDSGAVPRAQLLGDHGIQRKRQEATGRGHAR